MERSCKARTEAGWPSAFVRPSEPCPPHLAAPQAAVMHLLDLSPAPALAGLLLVAAAVVATLYIARHWR